MLPALPFRTAWRDQVFLSLAGLRGAVPIVLELTDHNAALSRQASEATQQVHQVQQQLAALSTDLDAAHLVNSSLMAELNRPERNRERT